MTAPAPPVEPAAAPSLSAQEAAFAAAVLVALTAWLASVKLAVFAGFVRWGLAPDADALGSRKADWIDHVDRLMPQLLDIARLGWDAAQNDLNSGIAFEPGNQVLADQLSRTRNFLVRISDEVYKDIVNALNGAVSRGEDVDGQAAAVRRVLDVSGSENWPARSRNIAVTEVSRTWAFGGLAHALTVSQRYPSSVIMKMWDAKEDRHVRAAHDQADGQTVGVNEPFIVGFEALMAPGDPSGSAWNVCGCRCRPRFRRAS